MATFETISAADALAYSAAADTLNFQTISGRAALVTVRYLAGDQVEITFDGRTVVFGSGIYGETGAFPDGSTLFVGSPGDDGGNGTAFGDGLYGGQGSDALNGGAGDDLLQGNQGADALNGGPGSDVVYGGQGNDVIDLDVGANFGQGNLGDDVVRVAAASGPNTLLGGQGNDSVTGGDAADFLNGNLGDDSLNGGSGDDSLRGESGTDLLTGGAGADTFVFGPGSSDAGAQLTDRILDWSVLDRIDASGGAATFYVEMVPPTTGGGYGYPGMTEPFTYATALAQAQSQMQASPGIDIAAAQVGGDVVVFVDANGDDMGMDLSDELPDLAIVLVGVGLNDLSADNFLNAQLAEPDIGGTGMWDY